MRHFCICAFFLSAHIFFSGCAAETEQRHVDIDCSRGICGCWEEYTKHVIIEVTDGDARPVTGVSLFCKATQEHFGSSNELGKFSAKVKGRLSPGCGYAALCEAAIIRDKDGAALGNLQFGRLLRGYEMTSGELTFKLVADDD